MADEDIDRIIKSVIKLERKRILDRWIEIHKKENWVKDLAAFYCLDELAMQENYPPYDKNK